MTPLPDPTLPWPIPMGAVALCADKESLRLKSYKCEAGVWTNGWGETDGVGPGMVWTKPYADQRFCDSLTTVTRAVLAKLTEHPSANELGAMVVLSYNIGISAFSTSSVLRAHNSGNRAAAARSFALYNKFHNLEHGNALEVSHGLVIRRAQEAAMYLTPDAGSEAPVAAMPQAVAPETPLVKSPISIAGVATAAAGGVGVLQQINSSVHTGIDQIRGIAESVGISMPVAMSIGAVIAGGAVVYWRRAQRVGGWA